MNQARRFRAAGRFALAHLAVSAIVAGICASVVFLLWYPYPHSETAGGRQLFVLVVAVDVISGPLLSLLIFDPKKPRRTLQRDLGVIFAIQAAALAYGLNSVAQARPVWLAFEGDRFRVVSIPDIDRSQIAAAPKELQALSWTGPKPLGVALLEGKDPGYLESIELSLQGIPPAFRPSRWVGFHEQRSRVISSAKSLGSLNAKDPSQKLLVADAIQRFDRAGVRVGYLPLDTGHEAPWIVVVRLTDGEPVAYLPVDGW